MNATPQNFRSILLLRAGIALALGSVASCQPCEQACAALIVLDSQSGRGVDDAIVRVNANGGIGQPEGSLQDGRGLYVLHVCSGSATIFIESPTHRPKTATYTPARPRAECSGEPERFTVTVDPI